MIDDTRAPVIEVTQIEAGDPPPPPRPARFGRRRVLLVAAAVVLLVVTAVVAFRWGSAGRPDEAGTARPSPSASADEPLTVAQIYETLAPSVVSITSAPGGGSGTGVIVNSDGLILTAFHVVEGAQSIQVTFADGTRSAARIVDAAVAIDIAILVSEGLPTVVVPAVLGGGLAIGDAVVAIGNQLGLTGSTTAGVVSGLERTIARPGGGDLSGLVQFDAAVNPGSSGGPLVNMRGEVVGIVVALANPTDAGTFIGIGFAVPIGAAVAAGGTRQPQR
jgi:putative serine protease PepD